MLDIEPQHEGFLLYPSFLFEVGDLYVLGLCLVLQGKNRSKSLKMSRPFRHKLRIALNNAIQSISLVRRLAVLVDDLRVGQSPNQ